MNESNENERNRDRACGHAMGNAQTASRLADGCSSVSRPQTITATVEIGACHGFDKVFGAAFNGNRITRAGWNGKGQWVSVQHPVAGSPMSAPYLYLKNAFGEMVPWTPSQGDLFARDWAVLPESLVSSR